MKESRLNETANVNVTASATGCVTSAEMGAAIVLTKHWSMGVPGNTGGGDEGDWSYDAKSIVKRNQYAAGHAPKSILSRAGVKGHPDYKMRDMGFYVEGSASASCWGGDGGTLGDSGRRIDCS